LVKSRSEKPLFARCREGSWAVSVSKPIWASEERTIVSSTFSAIGSALVNADRKLTPFC